MSIHRFIIFLVPLTTTNKPTGDCHVAHNITVFACCFLYVTVVRWFPFTCSRTGESSRHKQTCSDQEVFNIRQFLLDYRKQKELAEGIGIEEDDTEDLGEALCKQ